MTFCLKNKVALVTGGSRGIGRAIVEALAREGATVLFTFSSHEAAAREIEQSLRSQGSPVSAFKVDVRTADDVEHMIQMIEKEHGGLDILVNNAGITRDGLVMAMEEGDWEQVLDTNLTGAFHVIKPAARLMVRRRRGTIINVSSIAGTRPGQGHCNYAASKGGLEAMTKALSVELAGRNIRVNCVAPGVIETDMSREIRELAGDRVLARIPLKRYGQVQEVAHAVLFLASDLASYITGTVLHVDGGMSV
jgi:3-oxoacyl-[acyl-carrier protein] reductase